MYNFERKNVFNVIYTALNQWEGKPLHNNHYNNQNRPTGILIFESGEWLANHVVAWSS